MKKQTELLSPAGDFECLVSAVQNGADAVYLASTRFGLRTFAGNFDLDGLKEAVEYAHSKNVKVYVTVNIIPHESDLADLPEYILYLEKIGEITTMQNGQSGQHEAENVEQFQARQSGQKRQKRKNEQIWFFHPSTVGISLSMTCGNRKD